jgi:hypothetical protein
MYKHLKMSRTAPIFILVILSLAAPAAVSQQYTPVRDSSVLEAAHAIWFNRFDAALAAADSLIEKEPGNPLGYFLKGTILQTISEEYRNDMYNEEIDSLLSLAIDMAEDLHDDDKLNPEWLFISGAAFGYRALHRSFHGSWFQAFRDGLRCSSRLKDALELDSTFYDAYLGLGAYDYYKTVMADDFLWLPFVSDRRDEGIAQIRLAADSGYLASFNAHESLLRIYLEEKRYDDLVLLADTLNAFSPDDVYCLLYQVYGLARVGQTDRAFRRLALLKSKLKESPWYNEYGFYEAELAGAAVFLAEEDFESADIILEQILSHKGYCKNNPYFEETYKRARDLKDEYE